MTNRNRRNCWCTRRKSKQVQRGGVCGCRRSDVIAQSGFHGGRPLFDRSRPRETWRETCQRGTKEIALIYELITKLHIIQSMCDVIQRLITAYVTISGTGDPEGGRPESRSLRMIAPGADTDARGCYPDGSVHSINSTVTSHRFLSLLPRKANSQKKSRH